MSCPPDARQREPRTVGSAANYSSAHRTQRRSPGPLPPSRSGYFQASSSLESIPNAVRANTARRCTSPERVAGILSSCNCARPTGCRWNCASPLRGLLFRARLGAGEQRPLTDPRLPAPPVQHVPVGARLGRVNRPVDLGRFRLSLSGQRPFGRLNPAVKYAGVSSSPNSARLVPQTAAQASDFDLPVRVVRGVAGQSPSGILAARRARRAVQYVGHAPSSRYGRPAIAPTLPRAASFLQRSSRDRE